MAFLVSELEEGLLADHARAVVLSVVTRGIDGSALRSPSDQFRHTAVGPRCDEP